jgi:sugar lactone lactonase YvrE
LIALRIGVDSIALDRSGEWLYYGSVTGDTMYRIRTRDLDDASLSAEALAGKVEAFAPKTLSDGLTTDEAGNVYLSDMEHSAILTLGPEKKLTTLFKDPKLRWPDGFSFGPDGWLYVTCSSLQHVLFLPPESVREHAPYQIFRFKPGPQATPGH